ncbi:MAG: PKD domain-containing protein [Flavobacteriales bacterium]
MTRGAAFLAAAALCLEAAAQCGPCAVGDTCTVNPPAPAVCPTVTPAGVVGVPYELDVTFWLPPSVPEPTTGLNVVLQQVALQHMERLPLGLTYEASSPSLVFYPQQDPFGCVRICGIPMAPSSDTLLLFARAQGTIGGIGATQDYTIPIPFLVLPASTDTTPDFLFAPDSLCAPMTVSFTAPASAPGMTAVFEWSFGDGSSFSGAAPPDQIYDEGGAYPATLTSTFSVPMITQLSVSGVSNAWCGDLDEPSLPLIGCIGQPDLYFTLIDSRLSLYRSPVVSNAQSTAWSDLAIPLGFPPFTLRIYDKDELSDDDLLGTFEITSASGAQPFAQGGTSGSRTVQVQTVLVRSFTDMVTVFPSPEPVLVADEATMTICATPPDLADYTWSLNGEALPGLSGPCAPLANGLWALTATSAQGCSGSASLTVSGVGVQERAGRAPGWRLAPTPASDELLVLLEEAIGAELLVEIADPGGRVVVPRFAPGGPSRVLRIGLAGLSDGLYVLRLSSGEGVASRPFVLLRR